ncbi:hypothetical protein CRE_30508 [Caenorhabditis remanei]|uniref:Serpentine receptor class gamma n=1 Tax=Caenorhabditis remanei TaxID=31234 RepID=E3NI59_CAERE|nr:hypothetical protein CRE_30508 [Caenorhabditis remanei]
MSFFNLKFLISFFYCTVSFIIYTLLIIMLLKNWKEFKSAFFHIVIADYLFIWQFLFPISLATVILCAVYFTRTILETNPYYVYNEALDMYSITADSNILPAYSNVINFMAIAVVSSILLNTVSVIKLKLMTQNLSTIEKNLLFSTIASSVIQCAAAGNTFLLQLDRSRTTVLGQLGQLLLPFFSDFLTISQPYILIFLSSKVRLEMLKMYFPKFKAVKVNSIIVKTQEIFMSFFNLKFLISFFYCSVSFTIYTLLMIMLLKNWKEFKSAFFHIVIADYLFNLLTWLNSMITLRLPNGTCKTCIMSEIFGALGKDNQYTGGFLYICYFLHFGNAYFQYGMITMMSVNRATSIFFYFINEKIWKILFPILLALVIVVTVFGTRTILATVPYYTFNEALDMYTIKSDSNILPAYYNVIYFMAFSVSLSVFLNVISVIRLKMIQHKISTVERNLLLVTIFSSIIQCFAAGNTFVLQLDPTRTTLAGQAAQVILPFASDFLTISQPYVLIFLSSKVRSGFIRMYLYKYAKQFNGMAFTKTNEIIPGFRLRLIMGSMIIESTLLVSLSSNPKTETVGQSTI